MFVGMSVRGRERAKGRVGSPACVTVRAKEAGRPPGMLLLSRGPSSFLLYVSSSLERHSRKRASIVTLSTVYVKLAPRIVGRRMCVTVKCRQAASMLLLARGPPRITVFSYVSFLLERHSRKRASIVTPSTVNVKLARDPNILRRSSSSSSSRIDPGRRHGVGDPITSLRPRWGD